MQNQPFYFYSAYPALLVVEKLVFVYSDKTYSTSNRGTKCRLPYRYLNFSVGPTEVGTIPAIVSALLVLVQGLLKSEQTPAY